MKHRNPIPTVDIIIEIEGQIILIMRKNPPHGWAIPGGFIEYGESAEDAARREAKEETGLDIVNLRQFHTYSNPDRDPRHHTISVVFVARARGKPKACDDATDIGLFDQDTLPGELVFDHRQILDDYYSSKD
jgi:ADP-ribose pyrophosphatase YjhB (NUDIX family)